jgi:hypothetical protein
VGVGFGFMAGMVMVMRAVFARMVMVMHFGPTAMGVLMEMFVQVLVRMSMCMLVQVRLAVMRVLVRVRMCVVMLVQVLMFVLSFHKLSSLPEFAGPSWPS